MPDIREATVADARSIADVEIESWRAAYRAIMPEEYLDALSLEEREAAWTRGISRDQLRQRSTYVATIDDVIVGYATIGPDDEPDTGVLMLMYVRPEHWGNGAGYELMRASLDGLRNFGFTRAALWVLEANERARRFYERGGWTPDGARRSDEYGGMPLIALRYVREL